jgi:carboxymethylenebutenolidase
MEDVKNAEELSRRDFVAKSIAAGVVVATGSVSAAALPVTETTVNIKTPDGTCDAAFIHPTSGSYPAVIIWPDAFGLRPSMRGMARRLAEDGYSVLVPNPFYRVGKAPFWEDASKVDFNKERDKLTPLMGSVNAPGAAEKDAVAFVAWLDQQASVNKSKKIGTQGYCMGGALVVRTAAAVPNRIGAGASFHGGGLVTNQPSSPHLLAPKIKAKMYFGIASNDDKQQPDAKDKLREAFAAAKNPADIDVYAGMHGWCVPDMAGGLYDKPDAEKAWAKLTALYKTAL